jgi:hypothetical protein
MDKTHKKLFIIVTALLLLISALIISHKPNIKPSTPKKEFKIQKNIAEPVIMDTVIAEQTQTKVWPIRVITVERNVDKSIDMKWQVVAENGVMYYTNKKHKIGDIAFYINDNDEITDKYGNGVERTR